MTIKNILIRNAGLIIALLSIVITSQLILNNLQNRELQLKANSDQIVHDASSLILLTIEWNNFDTMRISRQWKLKYSQLKSLIDQKNDKYTNLQEDLVTLESNFNELMQTNKQLEQEHTENQLRVLTDKQKWLVTRNRVTSQAIVDKTNIISAQTMQRLEYLHQVSSWLMAGFLVVISLVMYIFSRRIIRRITQPLELLYNEVQKLENGEYTTGFDLDKGQNNLSSTRETFALARAIQSMLNHIRSNLAELKQQNTYIQTILDNIPLGVAVNKYDEGNATYINRQFEKIYGWPKEELVNVSDFFRKIYPDKTYREKVRQKIMEDINSGDPDRMRWERIEITTQSGEKKFINAQNIPLIEQNLMISTVEDITEMVHIRKDRDRIFENSIDMVCTASLDGYLLTLNPAWEKVLGWSQQELKAKPFIEFIHPDDIELTRFATKGLIEDKPALGFENRYRTKEGAYKWFSWNTIPILKEKIMLGIARDITEKKEIEANRKKAEQKLRDYQTELKKLTTELSVTEEKHRKEIAANIHDHLSQSLVISKMKINDLLDDQQLQPYQSALKYIKKQISEALENSRKITYDLSPPILYEMGLVETMYWLVEKTEEESRLKMEFHTEFNALKLSESTMILLYRSIQEIIFNVIKHARATIVSVQFLSEEKGLGILIHDNGQGFSVPDIWSNRARKGFGLFAVQERIQNLNGRFTIESTPGIGTKIKIYIPLSTNPPTNGN